MEAEVDVDAEGYEEQEDAPAKPTARGSLGVKQEATAVRGALSAAAGVKGRGKAAPTDGGARAPSNPPPTKKRAVVVDPQKEEEDGRRWDAVRAPLEEKVATAENEAEKVPILAMPLSMEATDDLRPVQATAIRDTERAVKVALLALSVAKRGVDLLQKEAENFAPSARQAALEELAKFQERLDAAQAKAEEYRHCRRDHAQAVAAEKLFSELATRLGGVEMDCEKAAIMAEPLAASLDPQSAATPVGAAQVREAKEALRVAQATLAPTSRLISGKVAGLKGAIRKKMEALQARAEAAQALLDKAHQTVEDAQGRAAAGPMLKQAAERVEKVEEVLQEMRETEAPFLVGLETMPADESAEVLGRMEKAGATAHTTLADAHKYIAMKLVEAARLSEAAGAEAKRELEKLQRQVDDGVERLKVFQEELTKRKRMNTMAIVKDKVEQAEAAIQKMKAAGAELTAASPDGVPAALEKAAALEVEAQGIVTLARRELNERQQELTAGGALKNSSDVIRTKVRVNTMEAELVKFRKLAKTFEERIKVGKSLADTSTLLEEAEADVDKLAAEASEWPQDQKAPPSAEESIAAVQAKLTSTTTLVEEKLQSAQGLELRELRGIFSRLQKAQAKLDGVKEMARQRGKSVSMHLVQQASDAVRRAEARVNRVSLAAASLETKLPKQLEALNVDAYQAMALVDAATKIFTEGQSVQLALESKVEFARLQLRIKALDRKGRMTADKVAARFEKVAADAESVVLDALRSRQADFSDADTLFVQLSEGEPEISEQQFCDFLSHLEKPVPPEIAGLAFKRLAPHGLLRRRFHTVLADFRKVVKEVTLTDEFEIQTAKKIRKLEQGELLEVTGPPKEDTNLGLERARCRAIKDAAAGWVTLRTGTTLYLARATKPFIWCGPGAVLRQEVEPESRELRQLRPGEVLELLEGPRHEEQGADSRVRGMACDGEASGWLQVTSKSGAVFAKLSTKVYKCSEAIAMTDVADFASCTMVRRIDAGEALELLDDEAEVKPEEGGSRRKFRACRDNRQGWITVNGSQGTVYVRPAPKHYICLQAAPMHAGARAESEVVRVLLPGEAFAAFEEPRKVSGGECLVAYRARTLQDPVVGWVSATAECEVLVWAPRHKVLKAVQLTKTQAASEAAEAVEVVRLLEVDEYVDIAEPPSEDHSTGTLRARCVAVSDQAVGWATVAEGTTILLQPAPSEGPAAGAGALAAAAAAVAAAEGDSAPMTPPMAPTTPPSVLRGVKRPGPQQVKEELVDDWGGHGGKAQYGKGKGAWGYAGGKGKWGGKWSR